MISVQAQPFDIAALETWLGEERSSGAVVSFVGRVRDHNDGQAVQGMCLEHYPGMTEKALAEIVAEAEVRWPLGRVAVVHRVGELPLGEAIVFVGVASAHRQAAFEACAYIMDYLKTRAPFWKKERTAEGSRWVDARESDEAAALRWS
ncbi:MAG: molybdopterin synthase catalytic subunit MoaE [Gammaproteobacteria bacterium]|nr:molybdopterin synthase catalytic subunit MoaE [Gammaproteobacteria bacterium]